MNILHLCSFLQGGAGSIIVTLATAQHAAGHHVTVVTSASGVPGYGNYQHHVDALRSYGVEVLQLDSLFHRDLADNLAVVRALLGRGLHDLDLVHAHAAVPSLIGLVLAGRCHHSVPVIQTMHGWGLNKTAAQARHDVAVLNTIHRVVVPSEVTCSQMLDFGVRPDQLRVVRYGVAPLRPGGESSPLEDEMTTWRRRGDFVVCCVGTLGSRKNQGLLVEALGLVRAPDAVLCVLVGDGDAVPLQQQAQALPAQVDIRVTGYRADARRLAAAADVLVLPSLSEGQPLAILEASCDGVPVVGSAIPEIADLIEHGVAGWLFPAGDAKALAATLDAAYVASADVRAGLATAARERWAAHHTAERMLDGYLTQYREARRQTG